MNRVIPLLLISLLAGCGGGSAKEVPQDRMCVYSTGDEAKLCKAGHMAWFKPDSWGNEQLPLLVSATYCDFNYQVLMNNAGVICVFTDKRAQGQMSKEQRKETP